MQNTLPNLAQPLLAQWQHQQPSSESRTPDLRGWWKVFNAPDLDALVEQSLAQNLTLAAAREHIHAARLLANSNSSKFLPELHARTDDLPSPSATSSYFRAGVDANWELGLFGKKAASQQVVDGDLQDVQAQAQMGRVSLVAEVVSSWVRLRTAQQHVIQLDQLIQQTQQQIKLTEQRVALGLAAESTLSTLTVNVSHQRTMQHSQQIDIDQSLQQLALLQGRMAPDPAWSTPTTQPVVQNLSTQTIPTDVIRIRPDIQQAEASVLQAAGQFGIARAERYPSVSIAGSYMYSMQLIGRFSARHLSVHGVGAVGPVLDIPLFDWGIRKATANARGAELNAAVLAYRQTVLAAVSEVESSLAAVDWQQQRVQEQMKAVDATQHVFQAKQILVQLGLASPLDALDEEHAKVQAQIELADLQMAHDLAYVSLYKALGGAPVVTDEANAPSRAQGS